MSMLPNTDSQEYLDWKLNIKPFIYWTSFNYPQDATPSKCTGIFFRIDKNGFLKELKLEQSCGLKDADFSCLESIVSALPHPKMPKTRTITPKGVPAVIEADYHGTYFFDQTNQPTKFPAAEEFFNKNPKLRNKVFLLHLIPTGIDKHYPGLFSKEELESSQNLIPITQKLEPVEAITPFYKAWQKYIRKHSNLTKSEIKKEAERIRTANKKWIVSLQ